MFGHELTYAERNPDYNTYMAQQAQGIRDMAKANGRETVGSGTPNDILMDKDFASGKLHTLYYNAAQGWREGGRQGKYTPPDVRKGETVGTVDYGGRPKSSSNSASSNNKGAQYPSAGSAGGSAPSGSTSSSPSAGVSSGRTLGNQPTPTAPSFNVQQPSGSVNYDTSISVGQATDPNRIRNLVNTSQRVDAGSSTGDRAVDDYTKAMNMNNQAQMDMAVQGANSQQMMNAQQKRSESAISGLNDQAAIYADAADRFRQALGLQTSVEAAQMSYNYGQQANNIRRLKNIARGNP